MTTCTLKPDQRAARLADWGDLLGHATSRDEARFTFPPDPALAGRIAQLAAAETQCCSSFRFELAITAAELTLRIDASPPR